MTMLHDVVWTGRRRPEGPKGAHRHKHPLVEEACDSSYHCGTNGQRDSYRGGCNTYSGRTNSDSARSDSA